MQQSSIALIGHTPVVRDGLSHILASGGFAIACSADSVADLLAAAGATRPQPGLVLIEDSDPDSICADVKTLQRRMPGARIAIIADRFEFEAMVAAIRAGVHGFLVAETSCASLIESLKLIAMGERLLPSQLADHLPVTPSGFDQPCSVPQAAASNLSSRELEIARCLITGCPNKVIARQLAITEAAVKVHVKAVLRKIRARNRTQAAIWAAHRGLTAFNAPDYPRRQPGRQVRAVKSARRTPVLQTA